jgi:hypothetical protein
MQEKITATYTALASVEAELDQTINALRTLIRLK